MSRLQRSPPTTLAANSKLIQVSSDSDIPHSVSSTPIQNVNITTRHKRPRGELSPTNDLLDFKHEILEMLTTWKNEQESQLSKFSSDQTSSMSKLVSELTELKLQNIAIQKTNMEIEKTVCFINKQYDDMLQQLELLQKERQTYKNCIQTLEAKIQDLQQASRPSSIEVRNVPPLKEKETITDLSNIISKLGETVKVALHHSQIRDIYRLPGKQGSSSGPIIAELTNVQTKSQLLTAVRDFNKNLPKEKRLNTLNMGMSGDCRPVYVAEHLPQSSRKLFFAAREFAKLKEFKYCWTSNGNIFLRKTEGTKHILIKSEQKLRELEVNQ